MNEEFDDMDEFDRLIAESSSLTVEEAFGTVAAPIVTTEPQQKKRGRKRKDALPQEIEPQMKKPPVPTVQSYNRPMFMPNNIPMTIPTIIMDIGRKDVNTRCIGRIRTKQYCMINESFKSLLDIQNNIVVITANGMIITSLPNYDYSYLVPLLKSKKVTLNPITEETILYLRVHLEDSAFDKTVILNEGDIRETTIGTRADYTKLFLSLEQQDDTTAQIKEEVEEVDDEAEEDDFDLEEELKIDEPSESQQTENGNFKELWMTMR
jgi:hypothetical protein